MPCPYTRHSDRSPAQPAPPSRAKSRSQYKSPVASFSYTMSNNLLSILRTIFYQFFDCSFSITLHNTKTPQDTKGTSESSEVPLIHIITVKETSVSIHYLISCFIMYLNIQGVTLYYQAGNSVCKAHPSLLFRNPDRKHHHS